MALMCGSLVSRSSVFNLQITKETWDDIKEYKNEYKLIIKSREKNRIHFLHQSPQRKYRKVLVEYLQKVSTEKRLHYSCIHLAVYLLDVFMDKHSIIPQKLPLLTNVCLLLAAKLEETNVTIPKIVDLKTLVHGDYSKNEHKALEIMILKFFNFNIMFPTPAHYTHYFMQVVINSDDLQNKSASPRSLILELHGFVRIYLDKIVEEVHLMQCYNPSVLAAAILSLARLKVGLVPWTEQLQTLTEYTDDDLRNVRDLLLQIKPLTCVHCFNNTLA